MKNIFLLTATYSSIFASLAFADTTTAKKSEIVTEDRTVKVEERRDMTADDQGGSQHDREITQKIRQAIMKDDTLSTNAQNVNIITENGHVTLKGPVNSVEEKARVSRKAWDVAGKKSVTNLLDVNKSE
jgi:hyperosmotically inducible periplasmic protein